MTNGVERGVPGIAYPEFSDPDREAVVAAYPHTEHFKEDIIPFAFKLAVEQLPRLENIEYGPALSLSARSRFRAGLKEGRPGCFAVCCSSYLISLKWIVQPCP